MFKKLMLLKIALLLQMLAWNVVAQADASSVLESEKGLFKLSYESQLNPIVINQMHSWILHIENAAGNAVSDAEITVSGGMPQHNHGLATAPSIKAVGNGNYQLQGLRFHMMGHWELELNISSGATKDKVVVILDL